jgi:putative copper resistance protein D
MTDGPTILVRFALYLVLAAMFGLSAFSLYGLRAGESDDAIALRPWLVGSSVLGLLLSAIALVMMVSNMAGTPLWPVDRAAVAMLLEGSPTGTAWLVRIAALFVAGAAALPARKSDRALVLIMAASGVAMASLAWTGHGAMDEGGAGWIHLISDILHLVAAAAWVGALLGLILLLAQPAERVDGDHLRLTHRALHGFGAVGTVVVATIVLTGLINSWLLIGPANVAALGMTTYGRLLLAKLALFVAMLGLASLNRFRLTPAFEESIAGEDHRGALRSLRVSLGVETASVVAILALVAWLGTLAPPTSGM